MNIPIELILPSICNGKSSDMIYVGIFFVYGEPTECSKGFWWNERDFVYSITLYLYSATAVVVATATEV